MAKDGGWRRPSSFIVHVRLQCYCRLPIANCKPATANCLLQTGYIPAQPNSQNTASPAPIVSRTLPVHQATSAPTTPASSGEPGANDGGSPGASSSGGSTRAVKM